MPKHACATSPVPVRPVEHLGALQVQFPLASNVHDFVPVTACEVE